MSIQSKIKTKPKVKFNEEALIVGPANMAEAAVRWFYKNCN